MKAWFYTILILVTCVAFAIRVKTTPKPSTVVETVDEDFERKKQNWAEFLGQMEALQEAAVREPSRPLIQWRQEILKLHYLWLEVRDYAFVKYEATKRAQIDAYVSGLVSKVEAEKTKAEILGVK